MLSLGEYTFWCTFLFNFGVFGTPLFGWMMKHGLFLLFLSMLFLLSNSLFPSFSKISLCISGYASIFLFINITGSLLSLSLSLSPSPFSYFFLFSTFVFILPLLHPKVFSSTSSLSSPLSAFNCSLPFVGVSIESLTFQQNTPSFSPRKRKRERERRKKRESVIIWV